VLDRSLALLRNGYPYLAHVRSRAGAAAPDVRLFGRRTTVVSGPAGVRLFYNEAVMRRRRAIPRPLLHTLFGRGAVHGLDDVEHRHRKGLFLELLTPDAATEIAKIADELWRARPGNAPLDPVTAFPAAVDVHCAAACRWAGVPPAATDRKLAADLAAIVDGFGSAGRRQLGAWRARRRVDKWARRFVARVRGRHLDVPEGSALARVARYRGPDGKPLPVRVAAVELINLLRPTVAVAYFVAFAAHALTADAALRARLAGGDEQDLAAFADEVRRYYPFVPMLAARVRHATRFQRRVLPRGRRVLLDVYGTLHDPAHWPDPDAFDIDRFRSGPVDPDAFVAQGGGNPATGHRCPGEGVATELIEIATRWLLDSGQLEAASTRIPLDRMPTRPEYLDSGD
jgi:fatty-acid peroxygenase